jgi:hypothetical protein
MADSIEEALYTYLTSDVTFMSNFDAVYWQDASGTTYPYVVYWMVDDNGNKAQIGALTQGEARIQFDLWDDSKARGARLKNTLLDKVEELNESRGGYHLTTIGVNQQTLQRTESVDPYHFVVDGILRWKKE